MNSAPLSEGIQVTWHGEEVLMAQLVRISFLPQGEFGGEDKPTLTSASRGSLLRAAVATVERAAGFNRKVGLSPGPTGLPDATGSVISPCAARTGKIILQSGIGAGGLPWMPLAVRQHRISARPGLRPHCFGLSNATGHLAWFKPGCAMIFEFITRLG